MGSLVLTTEALEPLSIHGWVSIPDAQDDVAEWTTGVLATALQFYSSTYIQVNQTFWQIIYFLKF